MYDRAKRYIFVASYGMTSPFAVKALVEAKGEKKGDEWVVTFTRKLAGGGDGDIAMASGKTYNFGFAIHDDHTEGRYHHVSLGYTLGVDAKADVTAAKQ